MRITKRIEEYIFKRVDEKARESTELKRLKEEADRAEQEFQEGWDAICGNMNTQFQQLLTNMGVSEPEKYHITCSGCWPAKEQIPTIRAYRTALQNTGRQVKDMVQEIIITMEMGGDKEDLNNILESVTFD